MPSNNGCSQIVVTGSNHGSTHMCVKFLMVTKLVLGLFVVYESSSHSYIPYPAVANIKIPQVTSEFIVVQDSI